MKTKTFAALLGVSSLLALQGCMAGTDAQDESLDNEELALDSSIYVFQNWGSGYCAEVTVVNNRSVTSNDWTMILDMKGSTIQLINGNLNLWNAKADSRSGNVSFTPVNYNTNIAPGGNVKFGFCADGWGRAAIKAWNVTASSYDSCSTNNGLHPTRAALAVAMGTELGRWKPEADLYVAGDGKVALTSTGLSRCSNGCPNTKALLGQQDDAVTAFSGIGSNNQWLFNATVYRNDLIASFDRQRNKMDDLARNNPGSLPPDHKLTLVGGPVNMGPGYCGPHYVYKVTTPWGSALSSSQAANLANALCFYGQGSCGYNPYIAFVTTSQGCPSGHACVAIDPTDGDTGSTSTTTAGSAPTYPLNRVWDPSNSLLNTSCITTTGKYGTLKSKCSVLPASCGYLYCTP